MKDEIEKSFYSIGEVASMFNVAPSLIRFWEKEFDELRPRKTSGGTRKFSLEDIETFRVIYTLVKEQGFTLEGAKEKMKNTPAIKDKQELVNKLKHLRAFLVELKETI